MLGMKYHNYDELTAVLKSLARKSGDLCQLSSLGRSPQGREYWLVTLTNLKTGDHSQKPAMWVDANTHAGEVTGTEVCLHLMQQLLKGYGTQSEFTALLDRMTFYFFPRISVDGAELYITSPHSVRSSPVPWPETERVASFYPKDINNDGHILTMRIPDPAGAFCVSSKDPRLMVQRAHDDFPVTEKKYYRLYTEGEFHQWDGFTEKFKDEFGLDLNRQAPAYYRPEGEQAGAGPYPQFSQEAQVLVKAITERSNIVVAHTYHTFGGMILRPSSNYPDEQMIEIDLEIFKSISTRAAELAGYDCFATYKEFRYNPNQILSGNFDEWHYSHRGIFSVTPEIWDIAKRAGVKYKDPVDRYRSPKEEDLIKILQWCDQNLAPGEYYQDWVKFQHSQLGEVEIGGWKWKYVMQNPPLKFLAEECQKVSAATLSFAKTIPLVRLQEVKVDKLSDRIFRLQILIVNEGFLSTSGSQQAVKAGAVRKPQVSLKLSSGQKFQTGLSEYDIEHLTGRSLHLPWHNPIWLTSRENTHQARLEWVIEGSGVVRFEAKLGRAGVVSKEISLS